MFDDNDIKITINKRIINLTYNEGEALLEALYRYFDEKDRQEYCWWEKAEGIPPFYYMSEVCVTDRTSSWFRDYKRSAEEEYYGEEY